MALDGLGKSLRDVIAHIGSSSVIDEELIREISKELQRALLQADVNVQLVLEITNKIQERALNEKPPAGKSSKDHIISIIYKELVALLDNGEGLALKPQTIMMVGLYGQGKTTTTGKLAQFLSKKGFTVGLIGADVYRPGALDQLQQLGEKINVDVYGEPGNKNAAEIVKNGMAKFSDKKIVIVDTSGRHALEEDLIQELKDIAEVSKPDERVLVLDSQVGQQAGPQADAFNKAVGVTAVILTKMDGTAKGGGALSAVAKTDARIIFIGTGEHIRDLEPFNADRFISRLLGMGDLASLVQMAKDEIDDEEAMEQLARNMLSGRFTLSDMYQQMAAVNKMGTLQKVMSMIPGFSNMENKINYEESQKKLATYKVIMDSMTKEEKDEPNLIKGKRIDRIAMGAGVSAHEVRELLKQYNQSKKMMGSIGKDRKMRKQFMKQMGGMDMDSLQGMQ
ncbi:MAG: signal recognition particle protein Srp54 [Candidatus Methanoplasma sp.]|jgi:signal recognition particle subunit SRP54|nr:signal recognition particle protein Srp54 [Candidatus Methanoplasma sp.]